MKMIQEGRKNVVMAMLVSTVAILMGGTGVQAQQGDRPMAGKELSSAKLESFASAFIKASDIYETYESRISKTGDAKRANALQQEANAKMEQAIKQEGLTVKEYNVIFNTVRNDSELKDQVNEMIQQKR